MNTGKYVPSRGDVVWISLDPQTGHEQSGRRPAVIVSPVRYNKKTNLALLCPVTTQVKNYPFEVNIPSGLPVTGVVLSDQLKNLDWLVRNAEFMCRFPESVTDEILQKLQVLLD